jgi:hypothetical protein
MRRKNLVAAPPNPSVIVPRSIVSSASLKADMSSQVPVEAAAAIRLRSWADLIALMEGKSASDWPKGDASIARSERTGFIFQQGV